MQNFSNFTSLLLKYFHDLDLSLREMVTIQYVYFLVTHEEYTFVSPECLVKYMHVDVNEAGATLASLYEKDIIKITKKPDGQVQLSFEKLISDLQKHYLNNGESKLWETDSSLTTTSNRKSSRSVLDDVDLTKKINQLKKKKRVAWVDHPNSYRSDND